MTSPSQFGPDQDVTYVLQVTNPSLITATQPISVVNPLPSGTSFRAAQGAAWSCSADAAAITCRHPGPLPGGTSLPNLELTLHLAAELAAPPLNEARVIYSEEITTTNNFAAYIPERSSQSIQFASLPDRELGATPFRIITTASSGLPVQLRSLTPQVCRVENTNLTLLATGLCTLSARQAGDWIYAPALEVQQNFRVLAAHEDEQEQHRVFLPLLQR
jgi:uncharacterized repeat protein (TIGR01451 family)